MNDEVPPPGGLDARGGANRPRWGRRSPYGFRRDAHRNDGRAPDRSAATYAALDLGTNNCRLLVARPTSDGFRVVDAFSRIIRLGEGIAAVPGDIDAIWCNGYGFPRFRGGPMFYADTLGLGVVLDGVHRFAETLGGKYWTPAPLLEELGRSGSTFQAWCAGARREESGA